MKNFEDVSVGIQKKRIVQDAITQIEAGVMIVNHMSGYFTLFGFDQLIKKDLRKILLEKEVNTCQGCAKGALFAACVLNVNEVKVGRDIGSEGFQKEKLSTWFSPLELDMIECAFERCPVCDSTKSLKDWKAAELYTPLAKRCIAFGKKYDFPKKRMLAILHNILKNKTFKP